MGQQLEPYFPVVTEHAAITNSSCGFCTIMRVVLLVPYRCDQNVGLVFTCLLIFHVLYANLKLDKHMLADELDQALLKWLNNWKCTYL